MRARRASSTRVPSRAALRAHEPILRRHRGHSLFAKCRDCSKHVRHTPWPHGSVTGSARTPKHTGQLTSELTSGITSAGFSRVWERVETRAKNISLKDLRKTLPWNFSCFSRQVKRVKPAKPAKERADLDWIVL